MSDDRILSALRAPYVSEKSTRLSEHNQYVFTVAPEATKADVKSAVEKMFDVNVVSVISAAAFAMLSPISHIRLMLG